MEAHKFVKKVTEMYEKDLGIFATKVNAEDLIPEKANNLQKALFLFYVIQLDYATKSQRLYLGAKKLFKENSTFFTPEHILNLKDGEILKNLTNHLRPRYVNEALLRYKTNSKILVDLFDSDPRVIFSKEKNALNVMKNISKFRGFGPKIGNFFFRSMVNIFGYKYLDIDKVLPPVDIWDVKIAHFLGYTPSVEMTTKNINKVKNIWSEACKKAKVNWLIFDKALWLLGSEGKPKNKADVFNLLG